MTLLQAIEIWQQPNTNPSSTHIPALTPLYINEIVAFTAINLYRYTK